MQSRAQLYALTRAFARVSTRRRNRCSLGGDTSRIVTLTSGGIPPYLFPLQLLRRLPASTDRTFHFACVVVVGGLISAWQIYNITLQTQWAFRPDSLHICQMPGMQTHSFQPCAMLSEESAVIRA